jgi:hypothetical protein
MHHVIYWKHSISENSASINITSEESSFLIDCLDACVEYEIYVRAMNERNESTVSVSNATTKTDGK